MCFTFFKDPKEKRRNSLSMVGPCEYDNMSMKESRFRSRCSAFISKTGIHQGRISMPVNEVPGPGRYRNNSTHFMTRSKTIKFDRSPRMRENKQIVPGPQDYDVNRSQVQTKSQVVKFTKCRCHFEHHNPVLKEQNPGPGAYDN